MFSVLIALIKRCLLNSPNFNSPNSNYRVRIRVRDRVMDRVRVRVRVRDSVRRIEKEPIKQRSFFVILPILNHVKRSNPLKKKTTHKHNMRLIVSS